MYGYAARAVIISDDGLIYRYLMRSEATFHDGSRLTAHDVAFSLNVLKVKGHPIITQLLRDLTSIDADDDRSVTLRFAEKRARDVPLFAASLPIFSRAYYEKKPFDESTLDIPLGSGLYKVGRFEPGRFIEFDRLKSSWGAGLPAMRGQYNFDTVRFEYYRDRDVAFEGFTGKSYLFREEFTSRIWATRYDFPAIKDGRVRQEILPDDTPSGAQGWFINTRRDKFKNPKLREALICAFDFEWTNKTIMYGSYDRTHSVFQNSDLMAKGKPSPEEVALLEPFRDKLPAEVFGEPYASPVSDGSGQDRKMLREAGRLLTEAGWQVKDGRRVNGSGETLELEFLIYEPTTERILSGFVKNLQAIGVQASVRRVDPAQYERRVKAFDFDVVTTRYSMRLTPGVEIRSYWASEGAKTDGSFNLAGISDPAIDALMAKVTEANSREALTAATRALDRVLRAGHYWVPHWYKAQHHVVYWDKFSRPAVKPRYERGITHTWWYDAGKASRLKAN